VGGEPAGHLPAHSTRWCCAAAHCRALPEASCHSAVATRLLLVLLSLAALQALHSLGHPAARIHVLKVQLHATAQAAGGSAQPAALCCCSAGQLQPSTGTRQGTGSRRGTGGDMPWPTLYASLRELLVACSTAVASSLQRHGHSSLTRGCHNGAQASCAHAKHRCRGGALRMHTLLYAGYRHDRGPAAHADTPLCSSSDRATALTLDVASSTALLSATCVVGWAVQRFYWGTGDCRGPCASSSPDPLTHGPHTTHPGCGSGTRQHDQRPREPTGWITCAAPGLTR